MSGSQRHSSPLPIVNTQKSKQQSSQQGQSSQQQRSKPPVIAKQVLKSNPSPRHESSSATKPKQQPLRSTKVSQKLVLFPQSESESTMQATLPLVEEDAAWLPTVDLDQEHHFEEAWQSSTIAQDVGVPLPIEWTFGSRTPAERMPKDERDLAGLPRVAAYCTGEGYQLGRLRPFLKQHHHVTPRLYDECLYGAYHFPLMTLRPDKDNLHNIRIRSSTPRQQRIIDDEGLMDEDEDTMQIEPILEILSPRPSHPYPHSIEEERRASHDVAPDDVTFHEEQTKEHHTHSDHDHTSDRNPENDMQEWQASSEEHIADVHAETSDHVAMAQDAVTPHEERASFEYPPKEPFRGGEVFIFDYGVVVFWNFRRAEELLMLEDLAEFSVCPFRDNPDEDMQIEEMHFQYDTSQLKPRIFNDMITLKSGNHMIKLTIAHGLSQSAVLARYEDIMDKTIEDTKHLPKEMAKEGRLDKNRTEITKINGQLFQLRMNVNLVSNVLDTPEIFRSEPSLKPMYSAIREYLEIPQRAKILNDRLHVISDLLSMLRDHLTNFGTEYQTLIIIYLIIVAVIVACFEIAVKILQSIDF